MAAFIAGASWVDTKNDKHSAEFIEVAFSSTNRRRMGLNQYLKYLTSIIILKLNDHQQDSAFAVFIKIWVFSGGPPGGGGGGLGTFLRVIFARKMNFFKYEQ